MTLITKENIKAYLKLTAGTLEDDMLDHLIAAATSEMKISRYRKFEYGTYTETFPGGFQCLFLQALPVKKIHSILADGNELAFDQYLASRMLPDHNPEEARRMIISAGAWGPLVFILMQVAQVLIAPIPEQVVGLIGGYLFGPLLGLIYTIIGATIGFMFVFLLARKLGRPFVERFVNKKVMDKFDHLTKNKGGLVFFLIYLLPAFPDDIISFIAGLTTIRIRTLVLISLAGRLPGYIVLNLTGNGLTFENYNPIVVTFAALVIIFALVWWKRAWLREFVEHNNRISFIMTHCKNSRKP
ncbi:TVP38/TMEM64 family protein [Thermoactinomyces mirandus]|uniref:TVP38/TMEM64 family protein n=1 Tax=Thermoactinomyces mirandus TaxID=2756294 RepID=UPI001C68D07D|nr:TVP38/TMEM64 family protein [Thermoactinomyces mirandus]